MVQRPVFARFSPEQVEKIKAVYRSEWPKIFEEVKVDVANGNGMVREEIKYEAYHTEVEKAAAYFWCMIKCNEAARGIDETFDEHKF